jgi:hypothetical protein
MTPYELQLLSSIRSYVLDLLKNDMDVAGVVCSRCVDVLDARRMRADCVKDGGHYWRAQKVAGGKEQLFCAHCNVLWKDS